MTTKVIQADREAAAAFFQAGSWPDLALAFASHADPLRRALEPFAKRCRETVRHDDDDNAGVTVRIKHLRAALAALSSGENNNGE